jgi:hypothetical protein
MCESAVKMRYPAWTCLVLLLAVAACRQGPDENLTSTKPYADLIGAKYEVVADDVHAYGIYESVSDKTIVRVTLIAGVGISGPEIAFKRPVPKGQVFTILSAWRKYLLFDDSIYYLVAVDDSDLPRDVPIEVELFLGNRGVGADLSRSAYRRIAADN